MSRHVLTMHAGADISEELLETIVAFVDREVGRDAPLTNGEEAMVRRLINEDPSIKALVDDLRSTNAQLDTMLDDVAAIEVPDQLVALIHGHAAEDVAVVAPKAENKGLSQENDSVVPMGPIVRRLRMGPLAAAASVGLIISCTALFYQYSSFGNERTTLKTALATALERVEGRERELADANAKLQRATLLAQQAANHNQQTVNELEVNEERMQQLEIEQAALRGENQHLGMLVEQQRSDLAIKESARDQAIQQLAIVEQTLSAKERQSTDDRKALLAEIDRLTAGLEAERRTVVSLTEDLVVSERLTRAASASFAKAKSEHADLERRLAEMMLDMETTLTERLASDEAAAEAERRLAEVEASQLDTEDRLAAATEGLVAAEAGRQTAQQQIVNLEADLAARESWLGQVAQYHRVYASTARRHLVEVAGDEQDHIQKWLTTMVGREILVPDLTDYGVTFAGARLLAINEKPVAQLVYLDANDQPLALCIIPSSNGGKDRSLSTNGDLNLLEWRDEHYGYAMVGWSDRALLNTLAGVIERIYDL